MAAGTHGTELSAIHKYINKNLLKRERSHARMLTPKYIKLSFIRVKSQSIGYTSRVASVMTATVSHRIQPEVPNPSINSQIAQEYNFHPNDIPGNWIVVHTKSKCEKLFANHCHQHSIPYYLPLCTTVSASRNRNSSPLFDGIVFIATSITPQTEQAVLIEEQIIECVERFGPNSKQYAAVVEDYEYEQMSTTTTLALSSHKVFSFLRIKNQPRFRRDLAFIMAEQHDKRTLHSCTPRAFTNGTPVRILPPHSLNGITGRIISETPSSLHLSQKSGTDPCTVLFAIQTTFLGQPSTIRIPAECLELYNGE